MIVLGYFFLLVFLNSSKVKEFCIWTLRINLSQVSYSCRLIPIMGALLSLFDNDSTKLKSYAFSN